MITLRRLVPNFDTEHGITEEMLEGLEVGNMSFAEAMKRIKPSTGREVFPRRRRRALERRGGWTKPSTCVRPSNGRSGMAICSCRSALRLPRAYCSRGLPAAVKPCSPKL